MHMLDDTIQVPAGQRRWLSEWARSRWDAALVVPIAVSLLIVGAVTVLLFLAGPLLDLDHAAFGYLIPVIIAATRWGVTPAIVSGLAGLAASAFFFYPPIYDIRVYNAAHVADLILFVVVAVVTGQLANRLREHVGLALQREEEVKALYFFSRRLAVASSPADIHAAIQEHVSAITGCRVALFAADDEHSRPEASPQWPHVPHPVQRAIVNIFEGRSSGHDAPLRDSKTGASWLIRTLSQRNALVGILAIELGRDLRESIDGIPRRIDAALIEAAATLERIDVARALGEAKLRSEAETLREALIGSVSHELQTPVASILGSTSVLAQAPGVERDARLSSLVSVIRNETERLGNDIQNLLDASRISSAGIRARLAWTEPPDIVNAALARLQRRLETHVIERRLAADLPLVRVDAVLIEQALSQIVDNAAKYSPAGSTITIAARAIDAAVEIRVGDWGVGLTSVEQLRLFERFYRGPRQQAAVKGSGLGLWIAHAFVVASGGQLEATSAGVDQGTMLIMRLPAPPPAHADASESGDA
jgi:two-component system sensor histidine kinase KdpD